MKKKYLQYLICPETKEQLKLKDEEVDTEDCIKSGILFSSKKSYEIINYIPRFVKDNYAENFGLQWNIHSKTQLDKKNLFSISEKRFFETTNWINDLGDEIILEAGCGMGRFTEQVLKTGATVISFDMSLAVNANFQNNKHENLLILQADIYNMPFKDHFFNKIFCFGVLQHSPDPKRSFVALKQKLQSKGEICIDVYRKHEGLNLIFNSKTRPEPRTRHFIRYFTKNMNEKTLYKIVKIYVFILWPLCTILNFIPYGKYISWLLCIADYRNISHMNFPGRYLDWAILDTYDMLSPDYDLPQSKKEILSWFNENNFLKVDVKYGYNGIEGKGTLK